MKREDISFLNQLVRSIEDAELKLERAYKNKDSIEFNDLKRFILHIQKQMQEVLK